MKQKTFAYKAIEFFTNIKSPTDFPNGISVMNPYENAGVKDIVKKFYKKFYYDNSKRTFLIGINPGRFGGGITGIAFTDPINLEKKCGIKNHFNKKPELSSRFIFNLIEAYGGVDKFYSRFFLTAVYPLALIREGKNHNFYDSNNIYNYLKKEIRNFLITQFKIGANKNTAICLGKKNAGYLEEMNGQLNMFKNIITIDHPRYIMQYKLKKLDEYVGRYIKVLEQAIKN